MCLPMIVQLVMALHIQLQRQVRTPPTSRGLRPVYAICEGFCQILRSDVLQDKAMSCQAAQCSNLWLSRLAWIEEAK